MSLQPRESQCSHRSELVHFPGPPRKLQLMASGYKTVSRTINMDRKPNLTHAGLNVNVNVFHVKN